MTNVTDYDRKQCTQIIIDVLQFLRSRNMSYTNADYVLEGAQKLLQEVARKELSGLPLAEGISYDLDQLMTASKRLAVDVV
jgi:hypothetical protein